MGFAFVRVSRTAYEFSLRFAVTASTFRAGELTTAFETEEDKVKD